MRGGGRWLQGSSPLASTLGDTRLPIPWGPSGPIVHSSRATWIGLCVLVHCGVAPVTGLSVWTHAHPCSTLVTTLLVVGKGIIQTHPEGLWTVRRGKEKRRQSKLLDQKRGLTPPSALLPQPVSIPCQSLAPGTFSDTRALPRPRLSHRSYLLGLFFHGQDHLPNNPSSRWGGPLQSRTPEGGVSGVGGIVEKASELGSIALSTDFSQTAGTSQKPHLRRRWGRKGGRTWRWGLLASVLLRAACVLFHRCYFLVTGSLWPASSPRLCSVPP